MTAFQTLLDQLVQSNASVRLEIVLQIMQNNRGGVRRKLETMLNNKLSERKPSFFMCLITLITSAVLPPYCTIGETIKTFSGSSWDPLPCA